MSHDHDEKNAKGERMTIAQRLVAESGGTPEFDQWADGRGLNGLARCNAWLGWQAAQSTQPDAGAA